MKTPKMAQYAALEANNSCLAALVTRLMAAENSKVKTISTPMAFNVCRGVMMALPSSVVLLRKYIIMTGTTNRMKIITVMRHPTSVLMRSLL